MVVVEADQIARNKGGGLERAVVGKRGGGDDEVEEGSDRGEPDEGTGGDTVDEEIVGTGIAEEEERSLKYKGQTFHMPGDSRWRVRSMTNPRIRPGSCND